MYHFNFYAFIRYWCMNVYNVLELIEVIIMVEQLRFLKMDISGHPLIKDGTELSLVADQRVYQNNADQLTNLFGRVWVNNLTTLVGRNATGKTALMKLVMGILSLLLNNKSIEQTRLNGILLGESEIKIKVYLYGSDKKIYLDKITLAPSGEKSKNWIISEEKIFEKKVNSQTSKKNMFDFKSIIPRINRQKLTDDLSAVLAKDDSIFRMVIAQDEYQPQVIIDTLAFTNVNVLIYDKPNVPTEILEYLDPTIEYLKIKQTDAGNAIYKLKFKGSNKEITDNNFATIEYYLSSGTAKGVTLYQYVLHALQTGGIIFVDELENHFNHAIVRTFIEYFTDPEINVNRATLVFSTHYSELLDDLERGDQIYFAIRHEKMTFTRFSDTDMREDLSRTEVFDADNLKGTSPDYEAYMKLKKATKSVINHE